MMSLFYSLLFCMFLSEIIGEDDRWRWVLCDYYHIPCIIQVCVTLRWIRDEVKWHNNLPLLLFIALHRINWSGWGGTISVFLTSSRYVSGALNKWWGKMTPFKGSLINLDINNMAASWTKLMVFISDILQGSMGVVISNDQKWLWISQSGPLN